MSIHLGIYKSLTITICFISQYMYILNNTLIKNLKNGLDF